MRTASWIRGRPGCSARGKPVDLQRKHLAATTPAGTLLIDAATGAIRRLTERHSFENAPTWTADGRALGVLVDERSHPAIVTVGPICIHWIPFDKENDQETIRPRSEHRPSDGDNGGMLNHSRCTVFLFLASTFTLGACGGGASGSGGGSSTSSATSSGSDSTSSSATSSGSSGTGGSLPVPLACGGPLFIDAIPEGGWTEVAINGGGMNALRDAIAASDLTKPTRITVAAGTYAGQCLYVEDHLRTATAPLWLRAQGEVQIDCHDGNGQAVGFDHCAYIAFDGFTIGPKTGFYGDSAVHIAGKPNFPDDPAHYGDYDPAHHIIVRNLTARNLNRGPDGDQNPDSYESGCCDAVKSNQAADIWVLNSHISRTARHGIDNVGVHRATICGNVLEDMVGAGVGMEAKGGSEDILFEANVIRRVRTRGIMLGGEGSGNVYMWPWDAKYEGTREIARNNVIINSAEAGVGFFGCADCAAVNNSIWVTSGYGIVTDHDMIRAYNSTIEGGNDYWGGSKRVGEILTNQNNSVINNLFGVADGSMTCALNTNADAVAGLTFASNLWWNGGMPLAECGDGPTSIVTQKDPGSFYGTDDPKVVSAGSFAQAPDLTPSAGSALVGHGQAGKNVPGADLVGKKRPAAPAIGALEP